MKPSIHPQYYQTQVHCAGCNTDFVTGSTIPTMRVDICSNCHPFYTGQKKLIDTEGRVERFERRSASKKVTRAPQKAAAQPTYTAPAKPQAKTDTVTAAPAAPRTLREMLQDAANSSR